MKRPKWTDNNVLIPTIRKVTEVYEECIGGHPHYARTIAMIAPDPMAGRKGRYSVIRIYSHTGQVVVIGRELPLGLARKVAKRQVSQDGLPL